MKKQWSLVIAIILLILIVVFALINGGEVPLNFGFTTVRWPLSLVIFGSILIGALIAALMSTGAIITERQKAKKIEKETAHYRENLQAKEDQINFLNERLELLEEESEKFERQVQENQSQESLDASQPSGGEADSPY